MGFGVWEGLLIKEIQKIIQIYMQHGEMSHT